jgi:hypothetical protein
MATKLTDVEFDIQGDTPHQQRMKGIQNGTWSCPVCTGTFGVCSLCKPEQLPPLRSKTNQGQYNKQQEQDNSSGNKYIFIL